MYLVSLRHARINKDCRLPQYPLQVAHQDLAQRGKERVSWREQHRVLVLGSLLNGLVEGQLTVLRGWHTVTPSRGQVLVAQSYRYMFDSIEIIHALPHG